jgi:methylated-DNA-[protein]-cysteine S-methyltransferase
MTAMLTFTTFDSPIGLMKPYVHVHDGSEALVGMLWDGEADRKVLADATHVCADDSTGVLHETIEQLKQYFRGNLQHFSIPLRPTGTEFQLAAWVALTKIPFGETSTYGSQAARIGRPTAVRAVGTANGKNPIPIIVPCHRVIGANGSLTGFAGGLEAKRWLLDHERRVAGHGEADGQLSLLR